MPSMSAINQAFERQQKYYETLGVGGMVTRGWQIKGLLKMNALLKMEVTE